MLQMPKDVEGILSSGYNCSDHYHFMSALGISGW
jgi:hypothetical protein